MTTTNDGPLVPSLQYTSLEALQLPDGSELCYDDRGDGPVLTFVNSPSSVAPVWLAAAGELAQTHRVLTYDLRNQGASISGGPVTPTTHRDDLVALLDHCGAERTFLVADSHSGYVACQLAGELPHRIAGVVLVDLEVGTGRDVARNALSQVRDRGLRELLTGSSNGAEALQELWSDLESILSPAAVAANLTVAVDATPDLDVVGGLLCPVLLLTSGAAAAELAVVLSDREDLGNVRAVSLAGPGNPSALHDPQGFRAALATFTAGVLEATPTVIDLRDAEPAAAAVRIPVPTAGEGVFA